MASSVTIKSTYNSEIRRFAFKSDANGAMASLCAELQKRYSFLPTGELVRIRYRDADMDLVTLASDDELKSAIQDARSDGRPCLHVEVTVSEQQQQPLQHTPTPAQQQQPAEAAAAAEVAALAEVAAMAEMAVPAEQAAPAEPAESVQHQECETAVEADPAPGAAAAPMPSSPPDVYAMIGAVLPSIMGVMNQSGVGAQWLPGLLEAVAAVAVAPKAMATTPPPPQASSSSFEQPQPEPAAVVHPGVECDRCHVLPIVGPRYKCAVREDYDICAACEALDDSPFPFLKIKSPLQAPAALVCVLREDQHLTPSEAAAMAGAAERVAGLSASTQMPLLHRRAPLAQRGGRRGRCWRHGSPADEPGFAPAAAAASPMAVSASGSAAVSAADGDHEAAVHDVARGVEPAGALVHAEDLSAVRDALVAAEMQLALQRATPPPPESLLVFPDEEADVAAAPAAVSPASPAMAAVAATPVAPVSPIPEAATAEPAPAPMPVAVAAPPAYVAMPAWARARPTARFVTDVTVPDGTVLAPSTPFVKTWRLSNEGSCAFGGPAADVRLVNVGGDLMGGPAEGVAVSDVQRPGAQFDVSLPLVAPARAGRYIGYWRMLSDGDTAWGHRLWVDIVVEESPETAAAAAAREEHDVDVFTSRDGDWAVVSVLRGGQDSRDAGPTAAAAAEIAAPEDGEAASAAAAAETATAFDVVRPPPLGRSLPLSPELLSIRTMCSADDSDAAERGMSSAALTASFGQASATAASPTAAVATAAQQPLRQGLLSFKSFGPDAGSGAASPPDAGAQSGKSPAATEDDWSAELSLLANMGFDDMDRILQLLTCRGAPGKVDLAAVVAELLE